MRPLPRPSCEHRDEDGETNGDRFLLCGKHTHKGNVQKHTEEYEKKLNTLVRDRSSDCSRPESGERGDWRQLGVSWELGVGEMVLVLWIGDWDWGLGA